MDTERALRQIGAATAIAINLAVLAMLYDQYEEQINRTVGKLRRWISREWRRQARHVHRVPLHIVRQINEPASDPEGESV